MLLLAFKGCLKFMSTIYETLYGTENDDKLTVHSVQQDDDYIYYTTIHGGEGSDSLTGTESYGPKYALYGDGGNDKLSYDSYDAHVLLSGGEGDDSIYAAGENKEVDGGEGYDKLFSDSMELDEITGIEELVIVRGETRVADFDLHSFEKISVTAHAYRAVLAFSHAIDLDDYTIETNGASLILEGSTQGDRFDLSSYSSRFEVYAGKGDDTIVGGAAGIDANGGDGNDYLAGSDGNDELSGGDGQNKDAYDTVLGFGGDDKIDFNAGGGMLNGGEGEDTLYIFADTFKTPSLAAVTLQNIEIIEFFNTTKLTLGAVDLSDVQKLKGDAELVMDQQSVFKDISILAGSVITIQGSQSDDVASFVDSKGSLSFHGGDGNDNLSSDGRSNFLWGEKGDDVLVGANGVNHLDGGDGNDAIKGGGKHDYLASGEGHDTMSAGDGKDRIVLTILGSDDVKKLNAGAGDDIIIATDSHAVSGHGRIDGGVGEDLLYARGDLNGHDVKNIETLQLQGKLTADADIFDSFDTILAKPDFQPFETKYDLRLSGGGVFTWHHGSEVAYGYLAGSKQNDILDFSAAENDWHMTGGGGDDNIVGTAFMDHIEGNAGDDTVDLGSSQDFGAGNAGNDTLYGGGGQDSLEGGNGNDLLDGGNDIDEIYGGSGADTLNGGAGNDYLVDYSGSNMFVFEKDSGKDNVFGFDVSDRHHDVIDLAAISSIKNFKDLIDNHAETNGTDHFVTIDLGGKNSIALEANIDDLRENMFIF